MSRSLRTFAALVLTVFFLTSPAAAAASPGPAGAETPWGAVWEWLLDILPGGPFGDGLPSSGSNGDAGVTIDPDGVTATVAQAERGREARQDR